MIDFCKSREHFDRFGMERIGPALASLGVEGTSPALDEFPVHEPFPAGEGLADQRGPGAWRAGPRRRSRPD